MFVHVSLSLFVCVLECMFGNGFSCARSVQCAVLWKELCGQSCTPVSQYDPQASHTLLFLTVVETILG